MRRAARRAAEGRPPDRRPARARRECGTSSPGCGASSARVGPEDGRQDAGGRRLAGTIRSQQLEDRSGRHDEFDAVERDLRAEALLQLLDADRGTGIASMPTRIAGTVLPAILRPHERGNERDVPRPRSRQRLLHPLGRSEDARVHRQSRERQAGRSSPRTIDRHCSPRHVVDMCERARPTARHLPSRWVAPLARPRNGAPAVTTTAGSVLEPLAGAPAPASEFAGRTPLAALLGALSRGPGRARRPRLHRFREPPRSACAVHRAGVSRILQRPVPRRRSTRSSGRPPAPRGRFSSASTRVGEDVFSRVLYGARVSLAGRAGRDRNRGRRSASRRDDRRLLPGYRSTPSSRG